MYEKLKSLARQVLPATLLQKNENVLRRLVTLRYRGSTYRCNCCGTGLSSFVRLERGDLLCPRCGSLPRGRRLWHLLSEVLDIRQLRILHFSPSPILARLLRASAAREYLSTDFAGEFTADRRYDITAIDEPAGRFDLIICYHVLEHVVDDRAALRELYRVLSPGGLCLLQTPFRPGEIYEDPAIVSRQERRVAFGQEDHVRVYSVEGLQDRLQEAGFRVTAHTYPPNHLHGWTAGETVLFAQRSH